MRILRSYQQDAITKSLLNFKLGYKRVAVSLPVGSGKTVVFANLVTIVDRSHKYQNWEQGLKLLY